MIFGAALLVCAGGVGEGAQGNRGCGALPRASDHEHHGARLPLMGRDAAFGLLGGFRVALADLAWIGMSHCWEECDPVGTIRGLRMATSLNPESIYFCLNAARIIAYDLAAWRIQASEAVGYVPEAERQRIAREQGLEAARFLKEAHARFPGRADPLIELGQVRLRCLQDQRGAAQAFAIAAHCPDAPDYAVRIAAELLRGEGRLAEARALLEKRLGSLTLSHLPSNEGRHSSEKTVLEMRLRSLKMDMEAAGYVYFTLGSMKEAEKDVE